MKNRGEALQEGMEGDGVSKSKALLEVVTVIHLHLLSIWVRHVKMFLGASIYICIDTNWGC